MVVKVLDCHIRIQDLLPNCCKIYGTTVLVKGFAKIAVLVLVSSQTDVILHLEWGKKGPLWKMAQMFGRVK